MTLVSKLCAVIGIAALYASCASSPVVGYHPGVTNESFVVTRDFQFATGPSSASKMNHTWIIPAGVYRAVGTDNRGTYYLSEGRRIRLKARFWLDTSCGLYRCGDAFFTYGQASIEMLVLFVGGKPYIHDQLPREFAKCVEGG